MREDASRVDVVVRLSPTLATAVELKLGETRVDLRRFKRDRSLFVMIDSEPVRLTRRWILVVRQSTVNRWGGKKPSFRHCDILTLEEVIRATTTRVAFNKTVADLLTHDDYYAAWGIDSRNF